MLRFFGYVMDIKRLNQKTLKNFEYKLNLNYADVNPGAVTYSPNVNFRFSSLINANSYIFPKFPKTTDPQRKTGEEFSFEGVVFESSVGFYNAVFEGSVSFDNAIFKGLVFFVRSKFKGDASFRGAQFKLDPQNTEVKKSLIELVDSSKQLWPPPYLVPAPLLD